MKRILSRIILALAYAIRLVSNVLSYLLGPAIFVAIIVLGYYLLNVIMYALTN